MKFGVFVPQGWRMGLLTGHIEQLAEAGVEYVIVYIPGVAYDHEPLQRCAEEVVPAFS